VYRPSCTLPITPPVVLVQFTFFNPRGNLAVDASSASITIEVEGVVSGFVTQYGNGSLSEPTNPLNVNNHLYDTISITVNYIRYSYNYVNNHLVLTNSLGTINNKRAFNYWFGMYRGTGNLGEPCISLAYNYE